MNVLILNGSPSGDASITLQTMRYLELLFPEHTFHSFNVAQRTRVFERDFSPACEALGAADLVVFCYPVYTFVVPAQLHRFVELMKASVCEGKLDLSGTYATQVSTSKHFYDVTAHEFIRLNSLDLGMRYVEGLSQDMDDLLHEKGQREAQAWWEHAAWAVEHDVAQRSTDGMTEHGKQTPLVCASVLGEPASAHGSGRVALVCDTPADEEGDGARLRSLIDRFCAACPLEVDVVDLAEFPFAGGCLGCFKCAADGTCVYKDGFSDLLRERIQTADATVYAFCVRDHSMGYHFKLYDDRQFCNGHRTVTMGKPVGYLVDGRLSAESSLHMMLEARAQVGGNHLAGIVSSEEATSAQVDAAIDALVAELVYDIEHDYQQPANFYGVGGLKIFRDLIYQMQGLMREDHRFYKKHGFYDDFPQKHRGTIAAMYLVGSLMRSKRLGKKAGANMTRGMLMPYEKAMEKARKQKRG